MLTRWSTIDPTFAALDDLRRHMDQLFQHYSRPGPADVAQSDAWPVSTMRDEGERLAISRPASTPEAVNDERWLTPPVDVYESEDVWLIRADLPGVTRDALTLHLDADTLTIEARRPALAQRGGVAGYRRSFVLPPHLDHDKVAAELNEGVVAIRMPKSEAVKPRRIAVKAG